MIRVAFSPSGSRRAGTKENNRVFEVQLLDHKVHEKLLVIISQEQEILHTLSTARAKFLEQAYPFRVSSHDVIFHRLLTHFEPSRIEGERLLVGLNFFFFSFFSLLLVSSLICLRSNSPWMDIYIFQRFQFFTSSTFVRSAESIFSRTFTGTLPDRENLRAILSRCNVTRYSLMISRMKYFPCDHLLNV